MFADVDAETEYQAEVLWMQANGIIRGYGDGNFGPDNCVTRAEFLKMLEETQDNEEEVLEAGLNFSDVSKNDWHYDYIRRAKAAGIIEGYADGSFKPNQCVNRVEAIKMAVLEYRGEPEDKLVQMYQIPLDVDLDAWYGMYLQNVFTTSSVGMKHIEFDDEPILELRRFNFFPAEPMTRKEVAVMLYRMQAVKDSGDSYYKSARPPQPDCRDGWRYSSENMPFDMCLDYEIATVGEGVASGSISEECVEGEMVAYRDIEGGIFMFIETDDYALTCDHGGGYSVDLNCLDENKTDAEMIDSCFSPGMEVDKFERVKTLDQQTSFYVELRHPQFEGDGMIEAKRYYLPLDEDYNATIHVKEGQELSLQNTFLSLRRTAN